MARKITWLMIYKDFKKRYPRLSKTITYWRPFDYANILIYLEDGLIIIYDYDTKTSKFLNTNEIEK